MIKNHTILDFLCYNKFIEEAKETYYYRNSRSFIMKIKKVFRNFESFQFTPLIF